MKSSPRNLWSVLERVGAVASLLGVFLTFWAIVRVGQVGDLVEKAAQWRNFSMTLARPADNDATESHLVDIAGTVVFEPFRQPNVTSVRLQLMSSGIEIVPFVRPITEPLRWWPQASPAIDDSGSYSSTVRAGREGTPADVGRYEIVVLAVPRGTVSRTDTFDVLPDHYAESNIVRVARKK